MAGSAFDANMAIDALAGFNPAMAETGRVVAIEGRAWISRRAWIEVLSKGSPSVVANAERFLSGSNLDELDEEIAGRAAACAASGLD